MVTTLSLEAGSVTGAAQGRPKKFDELVCKFFRTVGAKYGRTEDDLINFVFRPGTLPMDQPIPLLTDDKVVKFPASYKRRKSVTVVQDLPFPMSITVVIPRGLTYD